NARTPEQNGVAERKNKTLIEAARTMLANSFLPTTFWAEAVDTACYVLNRVLVTKPQNKTPYELLTENQANKSVSAKEANSSAGDKIEKNTGFKTCEKPVSQVEQIFLKELKKLKRQEKEADCKIRVKYRSFHSIKAKSP
nr:putative ribonuclease H-like domain-containing protein [Tanacetum cinerariifolium]